MIYKTLRDLDRTNWYKIYRHIRKSGMRSRMTGPEDPMIQKVKMVNSIRKYEHLWQVRVCSRFTDCDHASSTGSHLVSANYYAVQQAFDYEFDGAEGPGSCWLAHPSDTPERNSRDLVLEAFEDGHSHSVSEVRYESL
jgi:hypothetical protein